MKRPLLTELAPGVYFAVILILLLAAWSAIKPSTANASVAGCAILYPTPNSLPRRACIVRQVFHEEPRKAVAVAWCESTLRPWAVNGWYLGIFQMGPGPRARYGHGATVLAQAIAAHRYYLVSGWSPWECA